MSTSIDLDDGLVNINGVMSVLQIQTKCSVSIVFDKHLAKSAVDQIVGLRPGGLDGYMGYQLCGLGEHKIRMSTDVE